MMSKNVYQRIKGQFKKLHIRSGRFQEITHKTNLGFSISLDLRKDVDKRFYLDDFEEEILANFSSQITAGMCVIDIGANIGVYSLLAAAKSGAKGAVFSFEPADWAFGRLSKNIQLNNFTNIHPNKMGVSDRTGETEFNVCADDAYNSLGKAPMAKIVRTDKIKTITLDEFVERNKIGKVDIVKIDTEGAELLVFKGAEHVLREHHPKLFFEYNPYAGKGFTFDAKEPLKYLANFGYKFHEYVDGKLVEIKNYDIKSFDVIAS